MKAATYILCDAGHVNLSATRFLPRVLPAYDFDFISSWYKAYTFVFGILIFFCHLLCLTSGGGATNSPPHVLYRGISHSN